MSRRGDNIRKRTDGRWEGRYQTISVNGEKKYRSVYGRSYGEVKEKLANMIYLIKDPALCTIGESDINTKISCNGIPFCTVMEEWLNKVEKTRKYSTYVKYKNIYQCHIQSLFSNDIFTQITNDSIQDKIAALDISDSTRHSVLAVIRQTLRYAEEHYGYSITLITNKSSRKKSNSVEIMNRTEQARLMQFLHRDMDISKAGIFLCLSTGLRLGEVCALQWTDIDAEQKLLHVNRTVQRIESKDGFTKTVLLESSPKSIFSNREIPITVLFRGMMTLILP